MKRFAAVAVVLVLALGGCATIFGGADTPTERLNRVIDGLEAAMDGLELVSNFAGLDLLTDGEQALFKEGVAKAGAGVVDCVSAIRSAVERHEADNATMEAVEAEAGALAQ